MGTQTTTSRGAGSRVARRLAGVVAAATGCLTLAPGTAAAVPTAPCDAQLGQAQQAFETVHHVAIYLGNGQILEAPQSGSVIRVTSMRWSGFIGEPAP